MFSVFKVNRAASLDNPETAGLRFDTHQDALDFAAQCVQHSKDWLSVNDLNIVERYKKSELEIVCVLRSGSERNEYHLIFSSIPDRTGVGRGKESGAFKTHGTVHQGVADGNSDFMFIGDTYFVECPQEIIPSKVRLESAKKRLDFLGYVLAPTYTGCHVSNTSGEWESAVFGVSETGCDRNRVGGVVESIPKVLGDVRNDIADVRREFLSQFDFVNRVAGLIRIRLNNSLVSIAIDELQILPAKVLQVFLSPSDLAMRTLEGIRHG